MRVVPRLPALFTADSNQEIPLERRAVSARITLVARLAVECHGASCNYFATEVLRRFYESIMTGIILACRAFLAK